MYHDYFDGSGWQVDKYKTDLNSKRYPVKQSEVEEDIQGILQELTTAKEKGRSKGEAIQLFSMFEAAALRVIKFLKAPKNKTKIAELEKEIEKLQRCIKKITPSSSEGKGQDGAGDQTVVEALAVAKKFQELYKKESNVEDFQSYQKVDEEENDDEEEKDIIAHGRRPAIVPSMAGPSINSDDTPLLERQLPRGRPKVSFCKELLYFSLVNVCMPIAAIGYLYYRDEQAASNATYLFPRGSDPNATVASHVCNSAWDNPSCNSFLAHGGGVGNLTMYEDLLKGLMSWLEVITGRKSVFNDAENQVSWKQSGIGLFGTSVLGLLCARYGKGVREWFRSFYTKEQGFLEWFRSFYTKKQITPDKQRITIFSPEKALIYMSWGLFLYATFNLLTDKAKSLPFATMDDGSKRIFLLKDILPSIEEGGELRNCMLAYPYEWWKGLVTDRGCVGAILNAHMRFTYENRAESAASIWRNMLGYVLLGGFSIAEMFLIVGRFIQCRRFTTNPAMARPAAGGSYYGSIGEHGQLQIKERPSGRQPPASSSFGSSSSSSLFRSAGRPASQISAPQPGPADEVKRGEESRNGASAATSTSGEEQKTFSV